MKTSSTTQNEEHKQNENAADWSTFSSRDTVAANVCSHWPRTHRADDSTHTLNTDWDVHVLGARAALRATRHCSTSWCSTSPSNSRSWSNSGFHQRLFLLAQHSNPDLLTRLFPRQARGSSPEPAGSERGSPRQPRRGRHVQGARAFAAPSRRGSTAARHLQHTNAR